MTDPLYPSQENLARAKRKLDDLANRVNRYFRSDPYTLRWHYDGKLNHLIARREKDLDIDVAFDVVDIVLRLRAALDKAMVALVAANGRGTSGVGFPFGSIDRTTGQPTKFPSERMTGKGGLKKKLNKEQWELICALGPHPRGNRVLWAINEIANADKHRRDLVEVEPFLAQGVSIGNGFIDTFLTMPTEFQHILEEQDRETVLASMGASASMAQIDHRVSVSLVFGSRLGVDGRSAAEVLDQQIIMVEHILCEFRRFL